MKLEGKIEKILFSNGTNYASILVSDIESSLLSAGGFPPGKTSCVCAGLIVNPTEGGTIEVDGVFEVHPKYGLQFKVSSSKISLTGYAAIIGYLKSGFIKGVGDKTADLLISRFGAKTLEIIDKNPERLSEIKGISEKKAKKIHDSYKESNIYMDIMNEFGGAITGNQTVKIYEQYKKDAVNVIRKNPYQLIYDIRGFGFKTVDKMARKTGISPSDPRRVKAAILYTMENYATEGNCYMKIDAVASNVKSLFEDIDVNDDNIVEGVSELIKDKYLIYEDGMVYLKDIYVAETECAEIISSFVSSPSKSAVKAEFIDKRLEEVEAEIGCEYETLQKDAIKMALKSRISIITGGPGTGKTTTIYGLCKAFGNRDATFLCAPTGRAAQRMMESTGYNASTIHLFLLNTPAIPNKALFIMDEATMCDIELAQKYLHEIKTKCEDPRIVFVGDIDQLPSIGAGNFFRDLVNSVHVPTTRLRFSHRFGGTIAENALRINTGDGSMKCDDNFVFTKVIDKDAKQKALLDAYFNEIKTKKLSDVQILSPMKKGPTGTAELNRIIRDTINPRSCRNQLFDGTDLRVGDRVIQTRNNYELKVFNGDTGTITGYDDFFGTVSVTLDRGGVIEYSKIALVDLALSYAITIHKSQGSEYKTVLIPCGMENYIMLQRNLLYTAVTRAKEKVMLFSDPKTVNFTVRSIKAITRATMLRERISSNL